MHLQKPATLSRAGFFIARTNAKRRSKTMQPPRLWQAGTQRKLLRTAPEGKA